MKKKKEKPKIKRIPMPPQVKAQINRIRQQLDTYISGAAAAMGIHNHWQADLDKLEFIVEINNGKEKNNTVSTSD